jgi:hypothetical protein
MVDLVRKGQIARDGVWEDQGEHIYPAQHSFQSSPSLLALPDVVFDDVHRVGNEEHPCMQS